MNIQSLADACGGLAWISERLFEVEGRLATGPDGGESLDDRVRLLLARSSRRHGQHAQWWQAALPDSPALAGAARIRAPTEAWEHLLAHIEEAMPQDAVAALYEVALPQLAIVIEHLGQELSPVSDGEVSRTARMVAADLAEELTESKELWDRPNIPPDEHGQDLVTGFGDDCDEKDGLRWLRGVVQVDQPVDDCDEKDGLRW